MKKILRLTRHPAEKEQLDALAGAFGGFEITEHSETLPMDMLDAIHRFDELGKNFDVVEVVLPIHLIEAILDQSNFARDGGVIIKSVMDREILPDGNAVFNFDHYEEIVSVKIVTRKL